jgi:L-seryl-tRNA(Ser) seleniumtransferase
VALELVESNAFFGGGTSPEKPFPSRALAVSLSGLSAEELAGRLRSAEPPIVARIEEGRLLLDLRSVDPDEDALLIETLSRLAGC